MVLKELKKIADLGLKAAGMKQAELEKHLAPLIKAGKITGREAKSFAGDLISVGKVHHARVYKAVKKQVKLELKNKGYVIVKVASKKKAVVKKPIVSFKENPTKKKVVLKKKATKSNTTKKK